MRKGHRIRSDLTCNREARPSVRQRMHQSAFGLYRPLTEASTRQVHTVLTAALGEIGAHLQARSLEAPRLDIPKEFGVTYLERGQMLKALKSGLVRALEVKRIQERIQTHNEHQHDEFDVTLDGFEWFGGSRRKLAGFIEPSEGREFTSEVAVISDYVSEAGAPTLEVVEPNHVSLCKYRVDRNNYLAHQHRAAIGSIVRRRFEEAGVESLALGPIMVGHGYSQPLETARVAA